MNPAVVMSITGACLQVSFALTFLALSRAPGWPRATTFMILSVSAFLYSGVDVLLAWEAAPEWWVRTITPLNFVNGAVHVCGWVLYAFSSTERPWSDLPRWLKGVVAVTLFWAALCVVPGVVATEQLRVIDVPVFATRYHQPITTPLGDAFSLWLMLVLGLPFARFIGQAVRGERFAGIRVAGFVFFYGCALDEALVTARVYDFLFLGDLGFLGMVGVILYETIHRVIDDARALTALRADLERQVVGRTAERDVARDALLHAERLAALGQLAAGAGHEINNPLTVIVHNTESLRQTVGGAAHPDEEALLGETLDSAERIRQVVAGLRAYARPEAEQRHVVRVSDVVRSACKVAGLQLRHVATVDIDLSTDVAVEADPLRLSQVFVNLLVNAGQAVEAASPPAPRIGVTARAVGVEVCVEIQDNGTGMSAETLARLAEPYFTTRSDRGGSGLGLFVSGGIVAALGGRLAFESAPGRGTSVRVWLPTAARPASAPAATALAPPRVPRRWLVVDDESYVARSVQRALAPDEAVVVFSGPEALARLDAGEPFDVLLCDVMMPDMSGIEVYEAIAARHAARLAQFWFMTGGASTPETAAFLARADVRCLFKPFTRAQLLEAIRSADAQASAGGA